MGAFDDLGFAPDGFGSFLYGFQFFAMVLRRLFRGLSFGR